MIEKEVKYKFDGGILSRIDLKYGFVSKFNTLTGEYLRTDIIDGYGEESGIEAFEAAFPHLIDVGIMGTCTHGRQGLCVAAGVGCYQNGLNIKQPNMTLDGFKKIAGECSGYVDQFALGGRGDPDEHESFEEILACAKENRIAVNFTTSGLSMTAQKAEICKKYCGAAAVSWYRSDYTLRAIHILLAAGVRTNIHYVVSKSSLAEAESRLLNDDFPKGINAVVFLRHKPIGLGTAEEVIDESCEQTQKFIKAALKQNHPYKVAFDSCFVPILAPHLTKTELSLIDSCEGARFSMYISPDLKAMPCSFDAPQAYAYDLKNDTIYNAWNSPQFKNFRKHLKANPYKCPFL